MKTRALLLSALLVCSPALGAKKPPPSPPCEFQLPGYVASVKVYAIEVGGSTRVVNGTSGGPLTINELCNGSACLCCYGNTQDQPCPVDSPSGDLVRTCHINYAYPLNTYWIDIFDETGKPVVFFDTESGSKADLTSIRCAYQKNNKSWLCEPASRPISLR